MEEQFEGMAVVDFQSKLPAATVNSDHYKSGTVLRLAVEVRVKGVGYEEDKDGNYVRVHKLGIQDIEVVSAYDPSAANDTVGGSLAGGAPDPDVDVGLNVGRTADKWPGGVARVVDTETGEVTEGKVVDGNIVDPDTGEVLQSVDEYEAEPSASPEAAPKGESTPLDDQIDREAEEAAEPERRSVEVGF